MSFVIIGICQPNHDLALSPKSIIAPVKREQETCSPEASNTSNSWLSKYDKSDFLAKYSSNQNEPKNKDIDNKIIDIFAVNELSPESSDEDLEDEN